MVNLRKFMAVGLLAMGLAFVGCQPFPSISSDAANARSGDNGVIDHPANEVKPGTPLKACPEVGTTVLYGGQHIEVGYVDASVSGGILTVKLVGKQWTFTEVHIDVATNPEALHGSPGQMILNSGRLSNVPVYSTTFDLASIGYDGKGPLYIATHAVAHGMREGKDAAETSWGFGTHYGEGWGWYFTLPNSRCQNGGVDTGTDTGTDSPGVN